MYCNIKVFYLSLRSNKKQTKKNESAVMRSAAMSSIMLLALKSNKSNTSSPVTFTRNLLSA